LVQSYKGKNVKVVKGKVVLLTKHYARKTYGAVDVWVQVFLTSALVAGEVPATYRPWSSPLHTLSIGVWVSPRAGPNSVEK
jgi:hypothetical protein